MWLFFSFIFCVPVSVQSPNLRTGKKIGLFMSKQYKLIYQTHQYMGQIINYHLSAGFKGTMAFTPCEDVPLISESRKLRVLLLARTTLKGIIPNAICPWNKAPSHLHSLSHLIWASNIQFSVFSYDTVGMGKNISNMIPNRICMKSSHVWVPARHKSIILQTVLLAWHFY